VSFTFIRLAPPENIYWKNGLFYRECRNVNPILEFLVVNKNLIAKNIYNIDFP
jgi:hypothetical protein